MEPESLYPYTQRNLLDRGEYYMFSTYHGKAFLRSYYEQRAKDIADFEQRYLINLQEIVPSTPVWLKYWKDIIKPNEGLFSKDIQVIHARFLSDSNEGQQLSVLQSISELKLAKVVNTKEVLQLLLQTAVEQNSTDPDIYQLWLRNYIKRFEVSKKLYTAYYQSPMKKASEDYQSFLNYGLLSLVLLYDYEWSGNFKMVNTAIKLNDLLCSLRNEIVETEALLATIIVLYKEKSIIHLIMADKQVVL